MFGGEKKKPAHKQADGAFQSPTQLAAERFGHRSPSSPTREAATSRRSPKAETSDPGRDEIMAQMALATNVVVKKSSSVGSDSNPVASVLDRANAALATASEVALRQGGSDSGAAATLSDPPPLKTEPLASETPKKSKQETTLASETPKKETLAEKSKKSTESVASSAASSNRSAGSKDLDLKNNDNAFHVVANLVLERFHSRMTGSSTTLEVTEQDRAYLNQVLQPSVKKHFIEAVRFRLEHCPADSEAHVHVLTRQCRELGLDREGDNNPLLATPNHENRVITITNLKPALDKMSVGGSSSHSVSAGSQPSKQPQPSSSLSNASGAASSIPPGRPPQYPSQSKGLLAVEEENQVLRAQLEEQRRQLKQQHEDMQQRMILSRGLDENSLADSTVTGSSDVQVSTTESLARQQLMAELREASNFMAESVTPEAAAFWRQHVVDLQARLRALHGEAGSSNASKKAPVPPALPQPSAYEPPTRVAEKSVQDNKRAVAEYERRSTPTVENIYEKKPEAPPPEQSLEESVVPATGDSLPMVDVISPADLPGGYHFEAEIDGERFLATVPSGGVHKGETFSCVMRSLEAVGTEPPVGRWRDRLSDCTVYGTSHPLFLNGLFCPLIALGQILTRMDFDWLAHPTPKNKTAPSPCWTMGTIVAFWLVMNLFIFLAFNYKWSKGLELSIPDQVAVAFLNGIFLTFSIYVTAFTRQTIREKYVIREQRCYDLEDCCCATFCMPCTICQMGRHTADYEQYAATCCTYTGVVEKGPDLELGAEKATHKKGFLT